MVSRPAIVVLGPSGLATARAIRGALGDAEIHGAAGRVEGVDAVFESVRGRLGQLFETGCPIIGICATGILVRALASRLADKGKEPPVVAVADDGSAVVPLLGGHHGANELARRIAATLGVTPAITTAGDVRFRIALDAPPDGWRLANPEDGKAVMARLLDGARVRMEGDAPWLADDARLPLDPEGEIALTVTDLVIAGGPGRLVYHPATLALGVGCERGCAAEELIGLVEETVRGNGLAPQSLALVASIDIKSDEAAVHALARHLGVPARFFTAGELSAESHRLANPSDAVLREVGCPGVAEGAALAASGAEGVLVVEKTKSTRATCAIARAPQPVRAIETGRPRGRISVVGLGPGTEDWRSPEASRLLTQATDWVGYGLYLDLAADLAQDKREYRFSLGEEEARVRHALTLAVEGRDVALVCSGDAGIYAMAALVFEVIDEMATDAPARRVEVAVAPGISAFQAAAARAGAPIGHDFCAISLSDLLTPWEVIERRIEAAADGDFVVAFYNPRSAKRRDQLERALSILSGKRPPEAPVIVASNLGRPEERVDVTTLRDFAPETVDMLTLVMVGSSSSRQIVTGDGRTWVYTPRGYETKRRGAA